MTIRTLYVSKLAKCPLICLGDLAGGPKEKLHEFGTLHGALLVASELTLIYHSRAHYINITITHRTTAALVP